MRLEKVKDQPIDLAHDATYIVFIEDGKPQIVFVLSHEDPMKMAQDQQAWSTRVKVHRTRRLNKDDGVVAGPAEVHATKSGRRAPECKPQ